MSPVPPSSTKKHSEGNAPILVRLAPELMARLEVCATRLGRSRSEVLRLLLMRELVWADSGFTPSASMFQEQEGGK